MVNEGEAGQKLREYLTSLERQLGKRPKAVCAENGCEYLNTATETWCKDVGIDLQVTAPYLPAQNGVSERFNQTLMELARAMRLDANLPEFLWPMLPMSATGPTRGPCPARHHIKHGWVQSPMSDICNHLVRLFGS